MKNLNSKCNTKEVDGMTKVWAKSGNEIFAVEMSQRNLNALDAMLGGYSETEFSADKRLVSHLIKCAANL